MWDPDAGKGPRGIFVIPRRAHDDEPAERAREAAGRPVHVSSLEAGLRMVRIRPLRLPCNALVVGPVEEGAEAVESQVFPRYAEEVHASSRPSAALYSSSLPVKRQ